ncbi:hypothetical protein ACJ73_08553, partial [Blastomyces percursus]
SSSKTDVFAALDSLSTLDAIVSDSESLDIAQLRQKRYSPKTQEKLDETRDYWERYCRHIKANAERQWDRISDSEETVRFLYAFLSWRCDIRRGKNNRYCPGIKCKSSLETFWKWWHLVLKQETASGLNKDTIVKVEDVVARVATEKKLALVGRPKKSMYIEDVAEFSRVVLTTTEMTFVSGWQRIQMLFFLQLAAITASRPSAILHLRYRDIMLILIRVPDGGRPRLFIFLKPEFTKRLLGDKALNEFKIPEIIFDQTLVLSPHICLLTMLFHIGGFMSISTTGLVLDSTEKLYSAKTEPTPTGFKICGIRGCHAGEITGFEEVAHPYNLRYAGAKAFNNSEEVTEALQNVMLQHADIRTFVKHYQVDVDVDAQGIVRRTGSQTALKLSPEESRSLNYLPVVLGRQDTVQKRKRELDDREAELERANKVCKTALGHLDDIVLAESNPEVLERLEVFRYRTAEAKSVYNSAVRELRNEKQRQAEPTDPIEAEYQRRINTIDAGVAFCGVEEGRPSRRPAVDDDTYPPTKRQRCLVNDNTEVLLHQAMESVQAKSTAEKPQACFRPCVCFLCVGNPSCSLKDRIKKYATPGSLTRHFLRRHINPP